MMRTSGWTAKMRLSLTHEDGRWKNLNLQLSEQTENHKSLAISFIDRIQNGYCFLVVFLSVTRL